ncbi:MAG TPA: hypothetical protein VF092_12470 [Longimicrobium sp.]
MSPFHPFSAAALLLAATVTACQAAKPARGEDAVAARPASPAPAPPAAQAPAQPARDHVLFAVDDNEEGHVYGEAVAVLPAGGGYRAVPLADSMDAFYARWLDRGHRYTLLHFGRPAGTVIVGSTDQEGCGAGGAELSGAALHPDDGSALATDLAIPAGPPMRRAATAAEVAEMTALLRRAVTEHGSGWGESASVRVTRILVPGGAEVLAGDVELRGDEADAPPAAAAFVIAERAGGAWRPAVTWVPVPPSPTEERPMSRLLLDAADLDGDGSPELVTRTGYSEWSQYTIYRRAAGGWTAVYDAHGGGC